MLNGELDVDPEYVDIVRGILLQEETDTYRFYGKTGGSYIDEDNGIYLGWFVGFVERGEHVYIFALNMEFSRRARNQYGGRSDGPRCVPESS
jgi:beta-lactamase class D